MKKLARLTALLLTGALLLALTACGAAPLAPEQQAKQQLLGEINSYRATLEFAAPLEEVKQLSDAEQIWVEQFRAAGKTELPYSKAEEHPLNQTKPDSLRAVRLLILLGLQAVTYSCTYPDSSSGNHRW